MRPELEDDRWWLFRPRPAKMRGHRPQSAWGSARGKRRGPSRSAETRSP